MERVGIVVHSENGIALVQFTRETACAGCHNCADGSCHECRLTNADATMQTHVIDPIGCGTGTRVKITSSSTRILGYAFAVYGIPVVVALLVLFVCSYIGAPLWLCAVLFFSVPVLLLLICKRILEPCAARAPLPVITEILLP